MHGGRYRRGGGGGREGRGKGEFTREEEARQSITHFLRLDPTLRMGGEKKKGRKGSVATGKAAKSCDFLLTAPIAPAATRKKSRKIGSGPESSLISPPAGGRQ